MWIATVPLAAEADLAAGRFAAVAALSANDPATSFARGVALAGLGRVDAARAAFAAAAADPALADAAAVETGFLDLTAPDGAKPVAAAMRALTPRLATTTLLAARAFHLLGVAAFRLMQAGEALDALTLAQKSYRAAGSQAGEAQVVDTLGMVQQGLGNETAALVSYASALALKTRIGDRVGAAITLGNLGRYCALLGRGAEARGFLDLDLAIAEETGDARGQARVLTDLAGLARDEGELATAQEQLARAHAIAADAGLGQLAFETLLERAITALAGKDADKAAALLEDARRHAGVAPSGFDRLMLGWVEARLIAASERPRAVALLNKTVAGFREADMPALEIEARLALAEVLLADGQRPEAEREVLVALKRARERSLSRYRVRIGELMERLTLCENVAEESGRPIGADAAGAVDGYIVRQRLGGGSFATVWRAFDVERAREVALKLLDLESRYARAERERLLDSARLDMEAANRARHPGLVKVFAIGRDTRGNVYLAVEFVAGGDLREKLDGRPARDARTVCATLADAAEALAALHAQGVVHRDLKPENIMLREDGTPVIVDFGIAHIAGLAQKPGSVSRGSPEYFSPQQARGDAPAASDDMYAFGVILWEWLHGQRPNAAFGPTRKSALFGSRAAPKTPDELVAALMDDKGAARPTAEDAARLLRGFAA
ncbi:MAG TPA: serine/threonine-protein kinase [Rhizomicrobium sp.]|jgi:tetratricopeptide (TPR) repeat protein|nr:serine/threonine-protein kinase [Rhizomicrobium sp.]